MEHLLERQAVEEMMNSRNVDVLLLCLQEITLGQNETNCPVESLMMVSYFTAQPVGQTKDIQLVLGTTRTQSVMQVTKMQLSQTSSAQ